MQGFLVVLNNKHPGLGRGLLFFKLKIQRRGWILNLVHYFELVLHKIRGGLARCRIILAVPYQEYLPTK